MQSPGSYNLGLRRATAALHGNHKKKKKTAQDAEASASASAQSQSSRGMLLAVFQSIGRDNSSLHHPRDTLVYAVAEKFSVSAMFTRIDIMQYQGGHCLRWNYQEHNCIESTLLMTTFYAHCSEPGNSINVSMLVVLCYHQTRLKAADGDGASRRCGLPEVGIGRHETMFCYDTS